jgi:hypothetical protein
MVALTDPVEGEDDEYNAWYSDTHLGEVLAIDGSLLHSDSESWTVHLRGRSSSVPCNLRN